MEQHRLGDLDIVIDKRGSREYAKVSYPLRYGCFSEIVSPEIACQFNLNGELKFLQGRGGNWPHPAEWLKRSPGGDWIYYSGGEYREIFGLFGEYYVPRLSYRSNCIFRNDPFQDDGVKSALQAWGPLYAGLKHLLPTAGSGPLRDFVESVCKHDPITLARRAERLHALLGGRISVLPPDTRHVDYDVIPLVVADGCLYHCAFCGRKTDITCAFCGKTICSAHVFSNNFVGDKEEFVCIECRGDESKRKAFKKFKRRHFKPSHFCSLLYLLAKIDGLLFVAEKYQTIKEKLRHFS
jgi:hypothetical protein